jgi:hypothetical protein
MYAQHPDPLGFINAELELYKKTIQKLPFHQDDVRSVYHELTFNILNNYYIQTCLLELSKVFENIPIPKEISNILDIHLARIVQMGGTPLLQNSFRNSNNRRIIIDGWSAFELAVTEICYYALSPEDVEGLELDQYQQVKDRTKKIEMSIELDARLKQLLKKNHLSHVAISRKCDALFKKAGGNYKRDIKADKEFLLFLGRFRNCIHSNYIFHGSDCEYEFANVKFRFTDGQTLEHSPLDFDATYLFRMLEELVDIFKHLSLAIDHQTLIPYPDLTAP